MRLSKILLFFLIFSLFSSLVYAETEPKPVLYGQAFDGLTPADGAIVTAYLQSNSSDNLTDIVGAAGNSGLSSYWKVNLANLNTNVQNGDIIVIHLTDGIKETSRAYTVNLDDGAVYFTLNLDPAFQDYDEDGFFADTDCDDNNPNVNPGATEVADGIDNDCDGQIDEGTGATDDDGDGTNEDNGDCNDNDASIHPLAEEVCNDGIDNDCVDGDSVCGFSADVAIYQGWTLLGLPYHPDNVDNSEELGQDIMDKTGIECDVIMRFNGATQQMEDDILGLDDLVFPIIGTEGYFIHCDAAAVYSYLGNLWE